MPDEVHHFHHDDPRVTVDLKQAKDRIDLGPMCICGHELALHTIRCDACDCPFSAQEVLRRSNGPETKKRPK
jgi:hypothetical protein